MPITFACTCGKTLRVKDDHAGKWVRCPSCKETAIVPEAEPEPMFEVVEDEPPPPPPAKKRVTAEPVTLELDDDEPPRRPRVRPDQEYDGPRKARKRKKERPKDEKPDHFALEKGIINSGVPGGLLAMVVAVVWFVVAIKNDYIFWYPPVLFVVGLIGFFRGLAGGGRD